MQGLKVIMLDIDGVLNSEESIHRRIKMARQGYLDRDEADFPVTPMVGYLNKIIEYTNAKIVISSTWRILHPLEGTDESKGTRFRKGLKDIFKQSGILGEIIDITPNKKSGIRGEEIKEWLNNHPEVTNYVILDDNSDMLEEQLPYFIQTTWKKGLEEQHADKAIEILNKQFSPRSSTGRA